MQVLKLNRGVLLIGLIAVFGLTLHVASHAETDGKMRQTLEQLDFSENMITKGIYAKSRHDVFQKETRKFVHGMPRVTLSPIYQPDVYTWELAMAAHRQEMYNNPPMISHAPELVMPVPIGGPSMGFPGPGQVQLMPLGPNSYTVTPVLPENAADLMRRMQMRAAGIGATPGSPLRGDAIKQKLLEHINSYGQRTQGQPLVPVLPPGYPRGRRGDSCDASFDPSF